MQIHLLPARTGWYWIRDAFRVLVRQPVALVAITFLSLLLMSLTVLVPFVGTVAPLVLAPALMVGLMRAIRTTDEGGTPLPSMLFAAFREDGGRAWRALAMLGAINAAATMAALALAAAIDGGFLLELAIGNIDDIEPAAVNETSLWLAAATFVTAYAPVQMAMWYSPLFIAWHRITVGKALFFSLWAVGRNWRAFLVYATGWFAILFSASILLRLAQGAFAAHPFLWSMIMSPISLVLITLMYCSVWPTWRDAVRERSDPDDEIDPDDDDPPDRTSGQEPLPRH